MVADAIVFAYVFFDYIKRKSKTTMKYRPVYLELSRFGVVFSLLTFLGTVLVAVNAAGIILIRLSNGLLFLLLSALNLCLTLMKRQMSLRQAECDF